ncbi:MAG: ribbon-helix-helix protein, CopG family [Candidatus Acidulodesulfobacterium sp.]
MRRTQIYLDDEIYEILKKESLVEGKSASQIIRENLKKNLLNKSNKISDAIDNANGAWKDRPDFKTNDFIRKLRKGNRIDNF